ncbi:formate--tetrahydrofolate ligase [Kosmotoga pacifica]|uniref:Formate--tetrahydrofolate ligase n=1 Tax=Kosmotoga pacifica TaxID=1330330 RepID=A0A0G2ZAV9_9BACT|nr:formate--tetrahydrofolate ligase [Kosmotoga pacifica]AKI96714.1 formate--tetrahydrofolate ligase [Kosmotoga pacifica]
MNDLEIARQAQLRPITEIAKEAGIPVEYLKPYGNSIAKVSHKFYDVLKERPNGKLILVTAITPTSAGEGKTTTSIGLAMALNRIGKKTFVTLREPSLGPVMGIKGGAAGGGYAQVLPMEEINLHFTGDIHAVTTAHNLLSASIDAHIKFGNNLDIDSTQIFWPRAMDMNDRALRSIVVGLGGRSNGFPREDGFIITAASEVMAVLCLAKDISDLKERLGNIVLGLNKHGDFVRVRDLGVHGAMAAVLKDAIDPNLVQTIEGTPAFVHGGPFANIAHGTNSIIATKMALKLSDFVVTEAGFGADLGGEKFLDFVSPVGEFEPAVVVIVASIRALKLNGGADKKSLGSEDIAALKKGFENLKVHYENMRKYGVPVVVAINIFPDDTSGEKKLLGELCKENNIPYETSTVWKNGGKGGVALAERVVELSNTSNQFKPLISLDAPIEEKLKIITKEIYRAGSYTLEPKARKMLKVLKKQGFGDYPVIVAKTQYSISDDAKKLGAPSGYNFQIRDLTLSAGAGFVVAVSGDIMLMPGLPGNSNAQKIDIDENGEITGLF